MRDGLRLRPAEDRKDLGLTRPLRPVVVAGFLTLVQFLLAITIMYVILRSSVSVHSLTPMIAYILGFTGLWTVAVAIMAVRQPAPDEAVLMWGRVANVIILASAGAAVWVIWATMPHLSDTLQFFMVVFMVAFVPSQVIASPENTLANRCSIVAVLGSTAVFLATRGSQAAALLALFVAAFGVVMFVLCGRVSRTVQATVSARLASDDAATRMEQLAKAVTAERDAKTRFISAASHDLGQPLQAVGLFFEQSLHATDADARASGADGVRRALNAAEQLLSHMLNHLRLEADAVEPNRSVLPVLPLLQRVAMRNAPQAIAAGIGISVAQRELTLLLDQGLVDRALGNLVCNAVQHSQGSRLLLAARRHGHDRARLWVIDNGIGVSAADADHIFDDYYQGIVVGGISGSGFGLGLSSVRRTAELMGGLAGLDQRWRHGAAFYIELPLSVSPRPRERDGRSALADGAT